MAEELIVLVNDSGQPIGAAPKLESHHANTPLHKAFSCYIFDGEGRLLVTRRAETKKVWPGVWTNSVCGHPAPGESDEDAIKRRSLHELGMEVTDIKSLLPDYRYKTPPYGGIIENEICPVYFARAMGEPKPNLAEVEDFKWLSWSDYQADIAANPDKYSYWAKDQLPHIHKILQSTRRRY